MAETRQVIWLNGTSSSGKTTVARALQETMDEYYVRTGVDLYVGSVPARMHALTDDVYPPPHDGFQWVVDRASRRARRLRLGSEGLRLLSSAYEAAAALVVAGNNVVIDDVIFDRRVFDAAVASLHSLRVLFVAVRCPLEVAEHRELARGNKRPVPSARNTTWCTRSGPTISKSTLRSRRRLSAPNASNSICTKAPRRTRSRIWERLDQ